LYPSRSAMPGAQKKSRAIADPAVSALKASFVSRHYPVR